MEFLTNYLLNLLGLDSGNGVSPIDSSSLNGLNESNLIPGLVQDLQTLRFKLDNSVKKSEQLSSKLEGKMARKAPSITSEMSTQSDLSVMQKIIFFQ